MKMTNLANKFSASDQSSIKVCLRGIEGLGRKSLAFLLASQKNKSYEIVEEHPGAVQIIDIDDYRGKAAWEKLQSGAEQDVLARVILLGLQPIVADTALVLQKPFRPKELLEAIDNVAEEKHIPIDTSSSNSNMVVAESPVSPPPDTSKKLDSKPVLVSKEAPGLSSEAAKSLNKRASFAFLGTAEDVDLDNPKALAKVQYSPDQFLQHHFQQLTEIAKKEQKYIQVFCCEASFYIDPFQNSILTLVVERKQRSFAALPLDHSAVHYKKLNHLPEDLESSSQRYTFNNFIWRMALAGSRGRLPKNTDIDRKFKLRRWPNLTRLVMFPHATQISATWMGSAKSIREVSAMLSIPQRYIFAFFTAATATDLLLPADSTPQPDPESSVTPKTPHKRRGLFRRLLKTLKRKQGTHA